MQFYRNSVAAKPSNSGQINFRLPVAEDGMALNKLVADSQPLDPNSVYCNLLQCTHFAETSIAAVKNNLLIGFVSAYLVPSRPQTLFIWQVVVSKAARGQGLAKDMLLELLMRPSCNKINTIETTINPDNTVSWNLFYSLAKSINAICNRSILFEQDRHFQNTHPDEVLLTITLNNPKPSGINNSTMDP